MSQAPRHVRRLRRATRPWGLPDLQQSAQSNAETRDDDCDTVVPAACTGLYQWPFIGAVRREEHDAAEAMPGEAVNEVVDDHLQRLGPERQRPGEREMVLRAPHSDRRGTQAAEALGEESSEAIAEDRVGVERQVRSVLLDRTGRHDHSGPPAADLGLHLSG